MALRERCWLLCASFLLGFAVSAQGIRIGDLLPFGPSAGDQQLEAGNDQTHKLELDKPALFYDGSFSSIFVSQRAAFFFLPHRYDIFFLSVVI